MLLGLLREMELTEFADMATRIDREGGYREEASFQSVGGTATFSMAHLPLAPTDTGLVICPPILMDLLKNYRYEVMLARTLASRGIAVQRFHYRGTGHSEGEESEIRPQTLIEDALDAAGWLQERAGVRKIAFLGTRWGGRVAAAAAAQYSGAPLVLWDPVVVPGKYIRELLMGRLLREMKDQQGAAALASRSGAGAARAGRWEEEMAKDGRVDIFGYALHRWLYDSAGEPAPDGLLAGHARHPVLLVQISKSNTHNPDLGKLRRAIEAAGGTCEVAVIREEPGWLFMGHRLKQAQKLIRLSAEWLVAQLGVMHHA